MPREKSIFKLVDKYIESIEQREVKMNFRIYFATVLFIVLFALGCSSGSPGGDGIIPGNDEADYRSADGLSNINILGLYNVVINPSSGTVEAVPGRMADGVLNILGYLEPPPSQNLSVDFETLEIDQYFNMVSVDIVLTNPLDTDLFTGFEVRGVVFGPEVTNADGKTRWLNPEEFSGMPWGYQDGLLGTPDSYANFERLHNGYKLFTDAYPSPIMLEDMRMFDDPYAHWLDGEIEPEDTYFKPQEVKRAHYELDFGDDPGDFLIFNYAIIANYAFPDGGSWEPSDFPLEAHCPEPFLVTVEVYDNDFYYGMSGDGGDVTLGVRVYDWRDPDANHVTIESQGLGIAQTSSTACIPDDNGISSVYIFEDVPGAPTSYGWHKLNVTITDPLTYGEGYFLGSMPQSHLLYGENITVLYETEMEIRYFEDDIQCRQLGLIGYDDSSGEGEGVAAYNIYVNIGDDTPVDYVELDTTALGLGIQTAYSTKGGWGYVFPVNNDIGLDPGPVSVDYTIHLQGGGEISNNGSIYIVDGIPDPMFTYSVDYGSYGTIGGIDYTGSDFTLAGFEVDLTFLSDGVDTDIDEFRWIVVATTNTPVSPFIGTNYILPCPNDDPSPQDLPYYWTNAEAPSYDLSSVGEPPNIALRVLHLRPGASVNMSGHPAWMHLEAILVGVRNGADDVLLQSVHIAWIYETVMQGGMIYNGLPGGSNYARDIIARDFPDYNFQ